MREGWEVKTLGDIASIKGGKRVPKGFSLQTASTPYPYIRVSDFDESGTVNLSDIRYLSEKAFKEIKNYTISSKDVYISIAGTIGKTGIVPHQLDGANLTENACKLVLNKNVFNRFVLYYTSSSAFHLQAGLNTRTTAMPKLALSRLASITIPIPPLTEQHRIVSILDEAFAAIDKAKANEQKNLTNAKELFQSELNRIFSQKGEGWVEKKLGEVIELVSGQHIDSKDYNTVRKGMGYLTGPSDFGPFTPIVSKWTEHPKQTAKRNDILITVKGSGVGKINLMTEAELCISRQLMAIRANSVDTSYLYAFLSTKFEYFQSLSNGAAIPGISRKDVQGLILNTPDLSVQQEIVQEIDALRAKVLKLQNVYEQKLSYLEALKKSILQKAFSGELTKPALVNEAAA